MKTLEEQRAYNQKYHRENRTKILARNKRYREENDTKLHARRRSQQRKQSDEFMVWKQQIGCIQCGYNAHGAALDFHHKDAREKVCQITAANWKSAKGQAELLKCELLCANCHRIETCTERRAKSCSVETTRRQMKDPNGFLGAVAEEPPEIDVLPFDYQESTLHEGGE